MNYGRAAQAVGQYNRVDVHGGVESADPHRLIAMLLAGALDRLAEARGHMERREVAAKGKAISKAIAAIEGLRISLDTERGGELAARLDNLYGYLKRSLVSANIRNDLTALDAASRILGQIRSSWDAIEADSRGGAVL